MQGLEQRPTVTVETQNARADALVIVQYVEIAETASKELSNPQGVGQRLTETAAHHHQELGDVGQRRELRRGRQAKGVGVAVEIERANRREAHALVEHRPRRAGKDLDAVA